IADATASASAESTMTISVQAMPEAPMLSWARPEAIVYGTPLTASELNPMANVPGSFTFDPPMGQILPVGSDQLLVATFMPADIANFTEVTVTNLIDVNKAALLINADNKSKVYGQANPALSASYSGFVNGETAADLDTPVSVSTTATASSPVGGYPITASEAADANYAISLVEGALTIGRASLLITAENKSKVYGQANPELSASYSGLSINFALVLDRKSTRLNSSHVAISYAVF